METNDRKKQLLNKFSFLSKSIESLQREKFQVRFINASSSDLSNIVLSLHNTDIEIQMIALQMLSRWDESDWPHNQVERLAILRETLNKAIISLKAYFQSDPVKETDPIFQLVLPKYENDEVLSESGIVREEATENSNLPLDVSNVIDKVKDETTEKDVKIELETLVFAETLETYEEYETETNKRDLSSTQNQEAEIDRKDLSSIKDWKSEFKDEFSIVSRENSVNHENIPGNIPTKLSHVHSRDKENLKSNESKIKFKCVLCDKSFLHKLDRNNHIKDIHGPPPYSCKQCEKNF